MPPKQPRCRKGFGCVTALSDVRDEILWTLDEGDVCVFILLDVSKTFDMISHEILVSILHYIGFGESVINFIRSFLTYRSRHMELLLPRVGNCVQGGRKAVFLDCYCTIGIPRYSICHF